MDSLTSIQLILIMLIFIWSGFVRSALGFGGAALALPLFLLIIDDPIELLPVIGIHLIIFGMLTIGLNFKNVDWAYLRKVMPIVLPFKVLGVIGLLSLPSHILIIMVYVISFLYGVSYLIQYKPKVRLPWIDNFSLAFGSYMSGTALIGAPLMVGVFARNVAKERFRDTIFMLWVIVVMIKIVGFLVTDTNLNLKWMFYTLPAVGLGHFIGLKVYHRIAQLSQAHFMRLIGLLLLLFCVIGLVKITAA